LASIASIDTRRISEASSGKMPTTSVRLPISRSNRSFSDYDALSKDLQRQFHFLGESGVWNFLWSVDEAVPPYQEWAATHLPPKERERWSSRS
jgi:hypothetical protein